MIAGINFNLGALTTIIGLATMAGGAAFFLRTAMVKAQIALLKDQVSTQDKTIALRTQELQSEREQRATENKASIEQRRQLEQTVVNLRELVTGEHALANIRQTLDQFIARTEREHSRQFELLRDAKTSSTRRKAKARAPR